MMNGHSQHQVRYRSLGDGEGHGGRDLVYGRLISSLTWLNTAQVLFPTGFLLGGGITPYYKS